MKLSHLSASLIRAYEQCQMRYFFQYVVGCPEVEPHSKTRVGSAVHRMSEMACKAVLSGGEVRDPFEHKAAACAEFEVNPIDWRDVDRLATKVVEWGYFDDLSRAVGIELPFEFCLTDGTLVKGVMDRLDVDGDRAVVFDLKTGKSDMVTGDALKEDWQARIYNIAARRIRPEVRSVTVEFWCLRHAKRLVEMTAEDAEQHLRMLEYVADEIRACDKPVSYDSPLCRWCPGLSLCKKGRESL